MDSYNKKFRIGIFLQIQVRQIGVILYLLLLPGLGVFFVSYHLLLRFPITDRVCREVHGLWNVLNFSDIFARHLYLSYEKRL